MPDPSALPAPEKKDAAVLVATPKPKRAETRAEKIGREISFGIQQTLACWATDFIDPFVNKWFQNRFGDKRHAVTDKHVWYGEIVGDSIAVFMYLGIKRAFGKQVDALIAKTEKTFDPLLCKLAPKTKPGESKETHTERVADYKHFQAENIVDSSIIAISSTAANVATQRAIGNKQSLIVMFGGKIVGALITMGVMLGVRTAFPQATKKLDEKLSKHVFSPVVTGVQKLAGVAPEKPASSDVTEIAPKKEDHWASRVTQESPSTGETRLNA